MDELKAGRRVKSVDYGTGTVVNFTGSGVQVYWDKALSGTSVHILEHDRAYVLGLEQLPVE